MLKRVYNRIADIDVDLRIWTGPIIGAAKCTQVCEDRNKVFVSWVFLAGMALIKIANWTGHIVVKLPGIDPKTICPEHSKEDECDFISLVSYTEELNALAKGYSKERLHANLFKIFRRFQTFIDKQIDVQERDLNLQERFQKAYQGSAMELRSKSFRFSRYFLGEYPCVGEEALDLIRKPLNIQIAERYRRTNMVESLPIERIAQAFSMGRGEGNSIALQRRCFDKAFQYCEEGKWSILEPLTGDLSILGDEMGRTLLMKAAIQEKSDVVCGLIDREIGITTPDKKGRSPSHYLLFGAAGFMSKYYAKLIHEKLGLSSFHKKMTEPHTPFFYLSLPQSYQRLLQSLDGSSHFIQEGILRNALFDVLLQSNENTSNNIKLIEGVLKVHSQVFEYFDQGALRYMWLLWKKLEEKGDRIAASTAKSEYEEEFSRLMGFSPCSLEEDMSPAILLRRLQTENIPFDDPMLDRLLKSFPTLRVIYPQQDEDILALLDQLGDLYNTRTHSANGIKILRTKIAFLKKNLFHHLVLDTLSSLAIKYAELGEFTQAEHMFDMAIKMHGEIELYHLEKHFTDSGVSLSDISIFRIYLCRSQLYAYLRLLNKAEIDARRALALAKKISCIDVEFGQMEIIAANLLTPILVLQNNPEGIDLLKETISLFGRYIRNLPEEIVEQLPPQFTELNGLMQKCSRALERPSEMSDRKDVIEICHTLMNMRNSDPLMYQAPHLDARMLIANSYAGVKDWEKALEIYMECYTDRLSSGSLFLLAPCAARMGKCYFDKGDFDKAIAYNQEACDYFAILHMDMPYDEWRITSFANQVEAQRDLECALLKMERVEEALEVSDHRRASALCKSLSARVGLADSPIMKLGQMVEVARACDTTIVIYSMYGFCWVIDKEGNFRCIPIDVSRIPLANTGPLITDFPYRGDDGKSDNAAASSLMVLYEKIRDMQDEEDVVGIRTSTDDERRVEILAKYRGKFHEKLRSWYEDLIAPIEPFLPRDPRKTVTFVPDGQMALLPFAIFEKGNGDYFFLEHASLTAPSVKALSLLAKLREERKIQEERGERAPLLPSIVIGNPLTAPKRKLKPLSYAQKEGEAIATLLGTASSHCHCLLKETATVEHTLSLLNSAGWIHIACHGSYSAISKTDSLYKGALYLAPDKSGGVSESKGDDESEGDELFADDIARLKLAAECAFLSACYSGRGNLAYMHEGIVGMTRALLAGGTLTTASSLWKLPDSTEIVNMIEHFYFYALGRGGVKMNKAVALREAMLMAMATSKEAPDLWGGIFLAGLG